MDYTKENNGQFYKIVEGENIIVGELFDGQVLSSISPVTFITQEEYNELQNEENK